MKFLIIDDNPVDRELIIRRLRREFHNGEFVELSRQNDLEKIITEGNFDIVLTDYQLNWTNGLVILNKVKEHFPDIPVLMVTGTGSEEVAVEGMRSGLSNYILKKHIEHLPFAIKESLEKMHYRVQYENAIERLRASEERYREIFEQGVTGVFTSTSTGKLLTCNPAFARIFGFASVEEALERNISTFYPDVQAYNAFLQLLQQEKRLENYEGEFRRQDGESIYIVANVIGNFDGEGMLLKINGYLFDNSERKRLEEQLRQGQKMESLGQLVSGIAHDFNNMLGGIIGHAERGLSRVTANHPLYDNLYHIKEIATRGARVTRQLLAFSRKQLLEPRDLNLNEVISDLINFMSKILEEHIEIEFRPDPNLKGVHADSTQMEQVLMNLCVNARDAMPDGGKLLIETKNVTFDKKFGQAHSHVQPGCYILLSVKDTGIGMDEKTQQRIFEPFFTTKEPDKGTGLGLSTVHGIVGQHNGFIEVKSKPGKGATFTIYLPAVESVPLQYEARPVRVVQGGEETILVVEDDADLRELMEEVLREYGYQVISASNGEEGLKQFKQHAPAVALVVSDMMTPKMKGEELYNSIQGMGLSTRFLFISGYLLRHMNGNFVMSKDVNFLQKPFDLDELAAKVRDILEQPLPQ